MNIDKTMMKQLHSIMSKNNMLSLASAKMRENNMLSQASSVMRTQMKSLKS
jgi:hypothetical protein